MQLWSEDHFSGFEGKYYNYPAFYGPFLAIPKPYQKPYPPMLLPVDSQESFVPMGEKGYRIAIGAGSSPHNPRGSTVLKEDVRRLPESLDGRWAPWRSHHRGPYTHAGGRHQRGSYARDRKPDETRPVLLLRQGGHRDTDAGTASPDATAEVNLFGTPEEVIDKIEMLTDDSSTDEIMFEVNWTSSVPRDVVLNTMRVITDKLIPHFN